MAFIDTLLAQIAAAPRLDDQTKTLLTEFMQTNRALLEQLGSDVLAELFAAIGQGAGPAAWDALVARLDQDQLQNLLSQTGASVTDLAAWRTQARQDFQNFAAALATAGMRLVSGAVLAAL